MANKRITELVALDSLTDGTLYEVVKLGSNYKLQHSVLKESIINGTTNYVVKFTGANSVGNSQIFDNGTNVGIGTTAPSEKLTVNGNLQIAANSVVGNKQSGHANNGSIFYDFGSYVSTAFSGMKLLQTWDGVYNDEEIAFHTHDGGVSSGERMRINKLGNVGIGTTAPTAKVHISAGTTSNAPLKLTTGTALTTPQDGAIEYHSSHLYFTIGSTRYQLDQQLSAVGSDSEILYNSSGAIAANSNFRFISSNSGLILGGLTNGIYLNNQASTNYITFYSSSGAIIQGNVNYTGSAPNFSINGYSSNNSTGGNLRLTAGGGSTVGGNLVLTPGNGATMGNIIFQNIPTSASGLPTGAIWNNSGVLNIV